MLHIFKKLNRKMEEINRTEIIFLEMKSIMCEKKQSGINGSLNIMNEKTNGLEGTAI